MRIYLWLLLLAASSLGAHSIVFIHLGQRFPDYLLTAIDQARLFNPDCPIYVIVNQRAMQGRQALTKNGEIYVMAESLPQEPAHQLFKQRSKLDRTFRGGFWLYATERFFYLHELIKKYELSDVIHLESDVMLYREAEDLLPPLQAHYAGKIGATFDHNGRCIAGFFYVSEEAPIEKFTRFLSEKAFLQYNDMEFLVAFKEHEEGRWIEQLPIIMPAYVENHPLISPHEHRGDPPGPFYNYFDEFQSIFDAAAIGQYIGGTDPKNNAGGPGFINESCVFNPSYFQYEWIVDEKGRRFPVAIYQTQAYRINNLHVHCKNLKPFYSGVTQ